MSDEILVFNTEDNLVKKAIKDVEVLPVYGEDFFMLKEVMPEVDVRTLPKKDVSDIIRDMFFTKEKYNGIGISANQCGVRGRFFVIGDFICINPVIVNKSDHTEMGDEGCLSYPGLYVKVPRHKWIDVEFYDEKGEKQNHHFTGVTSRCFQHELDHLNGVRFTERCGQTALKIAREKQRKLMKKVMKRAK